MTIPRHPVRIDRPPYQVPQVVSLRAYEVYRSLFGEQKALIEGGCRGGFGLGELIAFLYARSFPEKEWRQRFDEAMRMLTANVYVIHREKEDGK